MSDVSKSGPLGEGEESRPLKVDLTRIDIRRGTLNLPRRFYDAFPKGELEADDTVVGRKLTVSFVPPRELEGLGPFFEEHDLQPNDAVAIAVAGGLQLTPVKRERRHDAEGPARSAQARSEPPAGYQAPPQRQSETETPARYESPPRGQPPRESVRLETERFGRDSPAQEERTAEQEPSRVRLKAQAPSAYLAPPVPETKGGWQDVLHDPIPRRGQMARPSERAVVRPDDMAPEGSVRERREAVAERSDMSQQRLFGEETERYGTVREAPRQQSSQGRPDGGGSRPLAPERELGRGRADPGEPLARHGESEAPKQVADDSVPSASRSREREARAPEPQQEERQPVLVGASGAEGDVAGRISRYLQDPGTPAIVRASAVAEELRLPLEAVQQGLAEVSRKSEGSVAPIRPDVYLVKRSR